MKTTKTLLLGMAVVTAMTAFTAVQAKAEPAVRSVKEHTVAQSTYTVGTRRVGMVGYHPYPLIVSQVDSQTVKTSRDRGTLTSSNVTTTTTSSSEPFIVTSGGGNYYTNTGGRYYGQEGLDIVVHNTGSFNN